MDLDDAIAVHAQWKTTFRAAITRQELMDAESISADNCCELGKWLHGDGRGRYGAVPQFTSLIEQHKAFHAEAGKVAQLINARQFKAAQSAFSASSPFGMASTNVLLAINLLQRVL